MQALWRQLAHRWGDIYEPAMIAVFRCVQTSHSGERDRTCESLFAYTVRSQRWLPVDWGAAVELVAPTEAWVDSNDPPKRIRERLPRISSTMYGMRNGIALASALGVTDASRPQVEDLLVLLASIAAEAESLGSTNREIDLAARWVQRTLDENLGDRAPHPDPSTVPLLARHDGQTLFVTQPPYTDDPLLRDTWERQRPVLSADTRLGRLTRYLSLTRLDDAVTTTPAPYGEHRDDEEYRAVSEQITAAKPYLLALVRAENSRAEHTARNALIRLELVICDSLVLCYEFDGHIIERPDAVCHIATRTERAGERSHLIGTAYLELDPHTLTPDWYPFGRHLAQHLGTPGLADAFTMVFTAEARNRERMMADRQIRPEDLDEARDLLGLAHDEEISNVLDDLASPPTAPAAPSIAATLAPPTTGKQNIPAASAPTLTEKPTPTAPEVSEVNYERVRIVDGQLSLPQVKTSTGRQPGYGGGGAAPTLQSEADKRRVGRRGETIVYHKERDRLRSMGRDPDLAVWVSKENERAPFDIRSLDEDGQVIYIEVKATRAEDPSEPFYISHAELLEAAFHRSRYYLYRVTRTDTAAPLITRVADPLGAIKSGQGKLLLNNAQVTLTFSDAASADQEAG